MSTHALKSFSENDRDKFYSDEEIQNILEETSKEAMMAAADFTVTLFEKNIPLNSGLPDSHTKIMILSIAKGLFLYLLLRHIERVAPVHIFYQVDNFVSRQYKIEYSNTLIVMEELVKRVNICHSKWFNPLSYLKNYLKEDDEGKIKGSPFHLITRIIVLNFFDDSEMQSEYEEITREVAYEMARELFLKVS